MEQQDRGLIGRKSGGIYLGVDPLCKVAMKPSILSLPLDCLDLVLSRVDYGKHKETIWALSGSCRTVKQAVGDCTPYIQLQGMWSRRQILGLCSALPNMAGLSFRDGFKHTQRYPGADEVLTQAEINVASGEIKRINTFVAGSKLQSLDFGRDRSIFELPSDPGVWHGVDDSFCLPEGLQELSLPRWVAVPERASLAINQLANLTRLECQFAADFFPNVDLIGLKCLSVSLTSACYCMERASIALGFFGNTLKRMTNLTKLDVFWTSTQETLNLPTALEDLKVAASYRADSLIPSSLASVTGLRSLELSRLPIVHGRSGVLPSRQPDLAGLSFIHLRRLVLHNFMHAPRGVGMPHLTDLCLRCGPAIKKFKVDGMNTVLSGQMVVWASSMTTVRRLELCGWSDWVDVAPLASMPSLTHLVTSWGLRFLAAVLRPGCLQSLETASLQAVSDADQSTDEECIATVASGLCLLPRFRTLSCPEVSLLGRHVRLEDAVPVYQRVKWRCVCNSSAP